MPSINRRFATALLAVPLLLAGAATGQLSMVPDGLLDFVPESCTQTLNEVLLPCAIENLCFALLPSDEELEMIPEEEDVESCLDIEVGLCPITSRCPLCKTQADDFFKCIIFGNAAEGALSPNVTDLVAGCSLDCSLVAATVADDGSEAPVASPGGADSEAPVAASPYADADAAAATDTTVEDDHSGSHSHDGEHDSSDDSAVDDESGGVAASFSLALAASVAIALGATSL